MVKIISLVLLLFLFFSTELLACDKCGYAEEMHQLQADTLPKILFRTPVTYPDSLRESEINGRIIVEVTVLPDSTIGYLEIKESIPELDSLALSTVSEWSFLPAYKDEEPMIGFIRVNLDYYPEERIKTAKSPLKTDLSAYYKNKRLPQKQRLKEQAVYSENYHLVSWTDTNSYITLNGFSVIPYYTKFYHLQQNYFPFYDLHKKASGFHYKTRDYQLPVTLVETYLGLGYLDNNYAHILLSKNNSLGVEDMQFNAGFLAQDGFWLTADEKSNNMAFNLYYPYRNFSLRLSSLMIKQDIPEAKFSYLGAFTAGTNITETNNDYSIYLETPILNAGYRYEELSYKNLTKTKRFIRQMLLEKDFTLHNHTLGLGWEYFFSDSPFRTDKQNDIKRAYYSFNSKLFDFNSFFLNGYDYKYYFENEMSLQILSFLSFNALYSKNTLNDFKTLMTYPYSNNYYRFLVEDTKSSITLYTKYGELNLAGGRQSTIQYLTEDTTTNVDQKEENNTPYLETAYKFNFILANTRWTLFGNNRYLHISDKQYYQPSLILQNNLECRYLLPHNNAITAGFSSLYVSEYDSLLTDTLMLDAYLRISITDLFDIQADLKNITSSENLLAYPVAGTHINVGLRWFFLN